MGHQGFRGELMSRRTILTFVLAGIAAAGCHVNGPVGDHPGAMATSPEPALASETTREVLSKRAPDTLVARDGSSCRVEAKVYAATAAGSQFRCRWVPSLSAPGA